jgi:hypothetical protein
MMEKNINKNIYVNFNIYIADELSVINLSHALFSPVLQSRKQPHHFGGAVAATVRGSGSGFDGSSSKSDVKHIGRL